MRSYTFRLTSEGFGELKSSLDKLGTDGEAALHKLEAAAPGFGAAMEAAATKAEASRKKLQATLQQELSDIAQMLDGQVRNAEKSFQALHASLDPNVAAQQRFAQGQAVVTDALKRGATTETDAIRVKALLEQQLRKNTTATQGFSTGLGFANNLLAQFGVALSIGAVVSWGAKVFQNTAALGDQAKQLQQTTDSLQAYRAEFVQNGSSIEEADKALAAINRTIGDAIDNVGDSRRSLAEWNISWRDLAAAAPEQRLALIAQGLLSIQDGARRARAEQALFGKSGREIETVLEELAQGIDKVIDRQKQMGTIKTAQVAAEAKASADQINQAFQQLETKAAPAVVFFTHGLTGLLIVAGKLADVDWTKILPTDLRIANQLAAAAVGLAPQGPAPTPLKPYQVNSAATAQRFGITPAPPVIPQTNYAAALDSLRNEADLSSKTASQRAIITAQLQLANGKLKDGLPDHALAAQYAGKQAVSQADILKILTPAEQAEGARLGRLKASGEAAEKLKNTFAKFLSDQQEEARIAGETVAQRNSELSVIQAAQIAQKERGVAEKNLLQTYAAATKELGAGRTALVESAAAARDRAELARDVLTPLRDEVSLAGQTRDARAAELEILRLKQQYGATAVSQSEAELRALLKQKDIMEGDGIIEDMRERVKLSGMSADDAEREAAVLDAIHATHGNLTADQAAQIRDLATQRQESERTLETAGQVQDVIANWAETGKASLSDLTNVFKRSLAQMTAQALFNPIILPITAAISGVGGGVSGLAAGSGGGFGGGGLLNLASLGGDSLGGFGSLGGIGSSISSGIASLGTSLGFSAGAGAGTSFALGSIPGIGAGAAPISLGSISSATPALPGSIFGATTLGSFAGGVGLGSLASSLVFGNKNDANMGGMSGAAAGALIGSIFPGVGTIIGGLAGGLLGGGLGSMTGSSNQGAIANFGSDGTTNYLFKQGGGNNGAAATGAANQVSQVITALKQAGVSVSLGNVTGLSIGSDKSYVYGADGMKEKLGGNDVDGVVASILKKILPSATGGNADAQAILGKYQQNGGITKDNLSQLTSDLGFAKTLQDLDFGTKQLTQSEQALKAINDQYQGLIDKASQLGLSTDKIEAAKQSAVQDLIDGFNDTVSSAIQQISDPAAAAAASLSAQQEQRIKEATALGADLTEVYKLNALETDQLTRAQTGQIDSTEKLLSQSAELAKQASDFNDNIKIQILGFTDPLQAALAAEDQAGKQRVDQAKAIGADIVQVEKLNALTRQKILDDSSKQITEAAAAAAAQLAQTTNAAKGSLGSLVADLVAGDASGLAPDQKYFSLLTQYSQASRQASASDPASIAGFQAAATALLPVAREFLGTSQSYGNLRDDILARATSLGGDLADPSGIGRAMVEATNQGSGAIVDAISLQTQKMIALNDDFKRLAALLQAANNRAA